MQEKSKIFILGSPKILIFGESVEQGVVLYKCRARSRTSLSLSECSIFPIGISSVLSRGYYLCNTYPKMFNFSLNFLLNSSSIIFLSLPKSCPIIINNSRTRTGTFSFIIFLCFFLFITFLFASGVRNPDTVTTIKSLKRAKIVTKFAYVKKKL